jgi:tRNA nucleotidyltransferase (CCA-adding enzyme)
MLTEREFSEKITHIGGTLYIAGGWVRDYFLGRSPVDKDYVVCGLTVEALRCAFSCEPVGRQFPVFLVNVDGMPRELALARTERKNGHGYHGFETQFTAETTIEDDLYRRDTTMNSMALRVSDGCIIDPFGGRQDIASRVIRATSEHFRDDPVRALRAARQSAQLGFSIAPGTIALMSACRSEIMTEPSERIFGEMKKALESSAPARFFRALCSASILDAVLPELDALRGVPQPVQYHRSLDAFDHSMEVLTRTAELSERPETRFAAAVHDIGKALTPPEILPHHYGHEQAGLTALEKLNQRMTLPRQWYRMAFFIISQHMKLSRARRPGVIIDLLEQMERLSLAPSEVLAVIRADHGTAPDFLVRAEQYRRYLDEARSEFPIPESIPPQQRREWIRARMADRLVLRLQQESIGQEKSQNNRIK